MCMGTLVYHQFLPVHLFRGVGCFKLSINNTYVCDLRQKTSEDSCTRDCQCIQPFKVEMSPQLYSVHCILYPVGPKELRRSMCKSWKFFSGEFRVGLVAIRQGLARHCIFLSIRKVVFHWDVTHDGRLLIVLHRKAGHVHASSSAHSRPSKRQ
jgi:hypothetical protein